MKSYLKSNHNHTAKHILSLFFHSQVLSNLIICRLICENFIFHNVFMKSKSTYLRTQICCNWFMDLI